MSFVNDQTVSLWQSFMPQRNEIVNTIDELLYCVQVYSPTMDFGKFDPSVVFEKWAAKEVKSVDDIPSDMESLLLTGGTYAVFLHRGAGPTAPQTFTYIFTEWLPSSGYSIDDRPHFEVLGEKYRNNHPDSEEEIWIPVKKM